MNEAFKVEPCESKMSMNSSLFIIRQHNLLLFELYRFFRGCGLKLKLQDYNCLDMIK